MRKLKMDVIETFKGDPTLRLILEAVRINEVQEERRMNDKEEWIIGKIPTATITCL